MSSKPAVVLASSSPQRRALLQQIGVEASCVPADIDESLRAGETAAEYVQRLACEKCQVVANAHTDSIVIGADTTISIKDSILAKAENLAHAKEILSQLSGAQHSVLTGVAIACGGELRELVSETKVRVRSIDESEIVAYWNTGEPRGKAGCYAIQGMGAVFIDGIEGSYSNVVGLPLHEVHQQLQYFGYSVFA